MKDLKTLGDKVKQERVLLSLSQAGLAAAMAIDTTLLSKIENGRVQPTRKQLQAIINALNLNQLKALELWDLSGRPAGFVTAQRATKSDLERAKNMAVKREEKSQPQQVNFNIDPARVQTLYSDIAAIVSNPNGMTLQFGKHIEGNMANVVASVGVSFEHAREIAQAINTELEKNER